MEGSSIPVYFVTMGNTMFVDTWLEHTKISPDKVYLDQDLVFYNGLKTKRGLWATFFMPHVVIWGLIRRYLTPGAMALFKETSSKYKLSVPEDGMTKGLIQGGTFVFRGKEIKYQYMQQTPTDHPEWDQVMAAAIKAKSG